jgi:hypothetical protein
MLLALGVAKKRGGRRKALDARWCWEVTDNFLASAAPGNE